MQKRREWSQKGRYLFKLFMALRLAKEGNGRWRFIAACKASQTCFSKLEKIMEEAGITDELGFTLSQMAYWGIDKIYPAHMISPYAVKIYKRWKEEQVPEAKKSMDQEESMLQALCQTRGESEEEVLHLLREAGLFTKKFLQQHVYGGK